MKKKFLFSGVAILTLLALAACTTPSNSSSSGSSSQDTLSSTSSSSQTTTGSWNATQKAVMTSHLNGYVMPYISLNADVVVDWDAEWECVFIESVKSPVSKVVEYKNILTTAGFEIEYDTEEEVWWGSLILSGGSEIYVNIYSVSPEINFVCDIYLD